MREGKEHRDLLDSWTRLSHFQISLTVLYYLVCLLVQRWFFVTDIGSIGLTDFKIAKSMPYNSTWQGGCHLWNYMGCLFIGNVLCFVLCATCHISFQLRHFLVEIVHFVWKLRPAQQPAIFEDCWQYHRKSLVFSAFVRVCQWEEGWYWCVMWRSLLEIRGLDPNKTPFHLRNLPQIKTCQKTKIASSFFPVIWFRQHIVYFCGLGNFKKYIQLETILNWYFFLMFLYSFDVQMSKKN